VVGGANDLLSIGGPFTLDGTLQVLELTGFGNGTYRLANYSGTFTNNGINLEPAFTTAHPGSFIDPSTPGQVNLIVVPEPGSMVSLFAGVGMLGCLSRFRRRLRA
jgi:fibronectin-binding autotransporter adhesin